MAVTDYERNPPREKHTSDYVENPSTGKSESEQDKKALFAKWIERKNEAEEDRKQFLPQIKVNRKFAAGKQHLSVNVKDGRVLDVRERNGVRLVTQDTLSQYIQTAVGRMAANDYRPNFLAAQENKISEAVTRMINMAFGWGWDNEWRGDQLILRLWRLLVIDGTAGIRCKYNKNHGDVLGEFYHRDDGSPMLPDYDKETGQTRPSDEEIRYVAENHASGKYPQRKTTRAGRVEWELLDFENMLPPPGFDDPSDFPWEIICRPVLVKDLKDRYPKEAANISEEEIENSGTLTAGLGFADEKDVKLKGRCMVYTGYERPCSEYPKGCTVVFTNSVLLDKRDHLPFDYEPKGPSTGVHYFRWQVIPGRFAGKAFIEGGIGPQQILNKRSTQIDTIIDRNMPKTFIEEQSLARPKTGEPMEIIEVRPGAPLPKTEQGVAPGAWMLQDLKMREEAIERALGMRSIALGAPPQGVTAYSAMALLNENNALQLDPIAQDFRMEMVEVGWDTMETMRNWPSAKNIEIAGPGGQLEEFIFNSNDIPNRYLVKPPRGGTIPRSQAAELQKINDIWAAAGGKLPLSWYKASLDAGKAQDLPPDIGDEQLHKAELENIAMLQSLVPAPVSPADDDRQHAESHRALQVRMQALGDLGDERAALQSQVLDSHIKAHDASAQQKAMGMGNQAPVPDVTGVGMPPQNRPADPNTPGMGVPALPEIPSIGG